MRQVSNIPGDLQKRNKSPQTLPVPMSEPSIRYVSSSELHERATSTAKRLRPDDVGCSPSDTADDWCELEFCLHSLNPKYQSERIAKLTADLEAAQQRVKELEEKSGALVSVLDVILPIVDNALVLETIHGRPYTGPSLTKELAELRAPLSTPDSGQGGK